MNTRTDPWKHYNIEEVHIRINRKSVYTENNIFLKFIKL